MSSSGKRAAARKYGYVSLGSSRVNYGVCRSGCAGDYAHLLAGERAVGSGIVVVFLVVLSLDRGGTSPGGVHFSAGCGGDGVLRSHYGCVDGPGGGSQSRHSAYADRSGIATGIGDVDGGADVAAHGQSGRLAGGTLHAGERVANRMGIALGAYAAVYRDDAGRLPYDIGQPGTTAGRDYFGVSVGVDGVSHRAVLPNCALDNGQRGAARGKPLSGRAGEPVRFAKRLYSGDAQAAARFSPAPAGA